VREMGRGGTVRVQLRQGTHPWWIAARSAPLSARQG
jgi:hypothetical protein